MKSIRHLLIGKTEMSKTPLALSLHNKYISWKTMYQLKQFHSMFYLLCVKKILQITLIGLCASGLVLRKYSRVATESPIANQLTKLT